MGLAFAAYTLLGVSEVSAAIVDVNANNYAPGTDISNAAKGMTLTAIATSFPYPNDPSTVGDVQTTLCVNAASSGCIDGSNFFTPAGSPLTAAGAGAWYTDNPGLTCIENGATSCPPGYSFLKVSLLNPTNYVQITGQSNADDIGLWAFNSDGQLIGSCTGFSNDGCFSQTFVSPYGHSSAFTSIETASFGSGTDDIATIYAAGYTSGQGVDSVTVNMVSVPEPGPLAILAGGLCAIVLTYRKRVARLVTD